MNDAYPDFETHDLDDAYRLFVGRLPERLLPDGAGFEALWALHPEEYHVIRMHGRPVPTPRWQQAYGRDYHYTGNTNTALPVPPQLSAVLAWAREAIDARLNGLLLNWYDGGLGHYIGPHHDSAVGMSPGSPIVTISLGEGRTFRLSHPETRARRDFPVVDGTVVVLPYDTNRVWKHAVPRSTRHLGRRISITLRGFEG